MAHISAMGNSWILLCIFIQGDGIEASILVSTGFGCISASLKFNPESLAKH
jgi:hypothetical protein